MTYGHAADAYRRTQAQAGTPLELVVMLYDGALRFLRDADAAMARRDIKARHAALDRVLAITGHLQNTLDMQEGGAIAAELDRLYGYINMRLLEGAAKHDPEAFHEVARLLGTLRDGWHSIATAPPAAVMAARPPVELHP